jgi:hypothetical protein
MMRCQTFLYSILLHSIPLTHIHLQILTNEQYSQAENLLVENLLANCSTSITQLHDNAGAPIVKRHHTFRYFLPDRRKAAHVSDSAGTATEVFEVCPAAWAAAYAIGKNRMTRLRRIAEATLNGEVDVRLITQRQLRYVIT